MGADLYREHISNPAREANKPRFDAAIAKRNAATTEAEKKAAQREVDAADDAMYPEDGYFRDSYNASSVLNQLGLSWWQDVIPMLNKSGNLSPTKCRELADMIEDRSLPEPELLDLEYAKIDSGENSRESWHAMFVEKRARLIRFLRAAADDGKGIYASL